MFTWLTWPLPKAGLKIQTVFYVFGGWYGDWLDLFTWPFWRHLGKAYMKYCPLSSTKRAECLRLLSLPQWCYHNFEPLIWHTNVHARCWRSWRTFLERFCLRWFSPLCTFSEAKYAGIIPVLFVEWSTWLPGCVPFCRTPSPGEKYPH